MAVELVGGALLSASIGVTFEKLASAEIGDYFRRRKLNEMLLKKLNITLLTINAVVDDAEMKQIRNQHVKVWLDAVKDAVLEAEDLLDEIDIEVSRCKLEAESQSSNITSKVWNFFNASSRSFDKEIELKMHEILDNLEYLASKKDILDLKATSSSFGVESNSQMSKQLPSTSLPADSAIYGRDVETELVASVPLAPSIDRLHVINCGELDFDYQPSTLRVLTIGGMEGSLLELVRDTLSCMSLESLIIRDCPTMNIPLTGCYNFLEYLYIRYSCDSLRTFPLVFFPKLQHLDFQYCSNLEMISLEHDNSLKHLSIYGCPKFVSFSTGRSSAPRLENLELHNLENIKSLPLFPSLDRLVISNCPHLESFSDGSLPSNLKRLNLDGCSEIFMASLKPALQINTSLKFMFLDNMDVECFPDIGLLPRSLTYLSIRSCVNLKKLDYEGLCRPSSLESLCLICCRNLQCLPVEGLPKSISDLSISGPSNYNFKINASGDSHIVQFLIKQEY
ncbi:hypothetical protein P8452_69480 [Trifolium repens]|nr:hypothetical protein P8452_69480 [Trifolium repens]